MKFELRHLRYVVAAAERGSFRGAAKALAVQESVISRRIRDLEDEIGAALFIRSHEGVKLTYAGQRFLYRARIALDQIGHAVTDVGAIGRAEDGAVRIGILSSMASGFLAELFQAFDAGHAGVRLEFVDGAPSDHFAAVRQHRLDVAFVTGDPALTDCDVTQLWTERLFVALPSHHKLAVLSEVDWPDLRGQPLVFGEARPESDIGDFLVKRLVEAGDRPMVERHSVGRDSLMQIVSLGRGLTLISEAATAMHFPGVIYRPLLGEELAFSAVWSPRNENPALRRMLSLARKMSEARSPSVRLGWFRPVHCKSLPAQEVRALLTARKLLQIKRIDVDISIRGILRGFGLKVGATTPRTFERRIRDLVAEHGTLQFISECLLNARAVLESEFKLIEKRIYALARHDDRTKLLMTTPGVGALVSLTFVSAIDDPSRFRSSRAVGAHFGLTQKKYQSGETDVTGRISKCGDREVRAALYEAANVILTRVVKASALKDWAMGVAKRAGAKKAKVALARKLAVVLHRMLADGTEFVAARAARPMPA